MTDVHGSVTGSVIASVAGPVTGSATGFVAPGFEPVAELLGTGALVRVGDRERRADLGSGGGAVAAYVDGQCVLDIWAGQAAHGTAWDASTRAVIMSATKGLTTLCAHILHDRGELDLDARVTKYWPDFGAWGKERTLVRHVLSHRSGAIGVPGADRLLSWDGSGWHDTAAIASAIAAAPPAWEPGTRHGYHGVTYGWLVGELVRRVSGVSLGTFFESGVARPLGADCRIGTPEDVQATVARVIEWTSSRPGRLTALDPDSLAGRSVLAGPAGSLFADETGAPRFASFMNTPAVLQAEIGSINATATARGLARVYAALAGGTELVSRESVARFSTEQVCGRDAVMGAPTRWAVGYTRESPAIAPGAPRQHGPHDEAFGHMGAGGQVGFADPVARVGFAFVRNHLEHQAVPLMGACLAAELYSCLDRQNLP
ncbi:MAG: serine hydrolase domain-containing protein [Acidimicrobiales bacterium]